MSKKKYFSHLGVAQIDPSSLVSRLGGEERATEMYSSYMRIASNEANNAENQNAKDILIIGVGNPYRHDDGIGHEIIKILQNQPHPNVDLLDGGTDGLALIDEIAKYHRAIIIDAVNMSTSPGTVRVFTPDEAKIHIKSDTLSTHGFGLAEVIKLLQSLNISTKLTIIGIEPLDISFGEGLSSIVESKIPEIMAVLMQFI